MVDLTKVQQLKLAWNDTNLLTNPKDINRILTFSRKETGWEAAITWENSRLAFRLVKAEPTYVECRTVTHQLLITADGDQPSGSVHFIESNEEIATFIVTDITLGPEVLSTVTPNNAPEILSYSLRPSRILLASTPAAVTDVAIVPVVEDDKDSGKPLQSKHDNVIVILNKDHKPLRTFNAPKLASEISTFFNCLGLEAVDTLPITYSQSDQIPAGRYVLVQAPSILPAQAPSILPAQNNETIQESTSNKGKFLNCPHCQSNITNPGSINDHARRVRFESVGRHSVSSDEPISWGREYEILRCCGCNDIIVHLEEYDEFDEEFDDHTETLELNPHLDEYFWIKERKIVSTIQSNVRPAAELTPAPAQPISLCEIPMKQPENSDAINRREGTTGPAPADVVRGWATQSWWQRVPTEVQIVVAELPSVLQINAPCAARTIIRTLLEGSSRDRNQKSSTLQRLFTSSKKLRTGPALQLDPLPEQIPDLITTLGRYLQKRFTSAVPRE